MIRQLQTIPERLTMSRPTIKDILGTLDNGAIALPLLILSLPAIVPTPGIPAGMLFGSVLVLFGLQMSLAKHPVRLPAIVGRLSIDRGTLTRIIDRALPHLMKTERWVYPRRGNFITSGALRGIGLVISLLGILIALPIPFGNTLPGLAVLSLALGIGQKDGVTVLAGLSLAVISVATSLGLLMSSWWVVERYFL